ncbi:hypothetical protein CUMW_148080 [Citrus unshiu]|nr:hypothetical protein CUMW_148080 [Citrus unshiu]
MQLRRLQKSFRGVRKRPWGKFAAEIRDGKKKDWGKSLAWGLMIHLRMLHWLYDRAASRFTAKKLSLIFPHLIGSKSSNTECWLTESPNAD